MDCSFPSFLKYLFIFYLIRSSLLRVEFIDICHLLFEAVLPE